MKKIFLYLLLILFPVFIIYGYASAFDTIGLQPTAPNGVFSAFSAESMTKNSVSLETGIEKSIEPHFYRFFVKGAYGLSDSLEFNFIIPYVYDFSGRIDGLEDVSIGFKHRFYDEGRYGPSIAYMLNTAIASGRDEFSSDGKFGVGLIVSKRVGPFKGHLNLFYEKPGTGKIRDEIVLIGGLEFSAAHNMKLLGEIIARNSQYRDKLDQIEARLGYRIKTTDAIHTTLGIGFDVKNRTPEYRLMLMVSYLVPSEKKKKKIYEEE